MLSGQSIGQKHPRDLQKRKMLPEHRRRSDQGTEGKRFIFCFVLEIESLKIQVILSNFPESKGKSRNPVDLDTHLIGTREKKA